MAEKLNPVYDDEESIPEAARPFYTEKDGKFVFDGVDIERHPALEGMRNALERIKGERNDLRVERDAMKDVDLDEYKRLKQEHEEAEEDRAKKAGEFEKLKTQLVEANAKALKKEQQEKAVLEEDLAEALIDREAILAIREHEGEPKILLREVRANTRLDVIDGKRRAVVLDGESGDKDRSPRRDDKGDLVTVGAYVVELRDDKVWSRAFEGTGLEGGGASKTRTSGAGVRGGKRSEMTETDKLAFIKERGLEEFKALPA